MGKARKKAKQNDILSHEEPQMAAKTVNEDYGKELYDLQQLLEIARSLCSTLDYSRLVESILYTCMGQMRVLGAGIFVLDNMETDNYILGTNYIGMDLDSEIEYVIPHNHPVIDVLNEKERVFFIEDIKNALPNESLEEIYSLKPSLILPLFQRNSINGILLLSERMDLGNGTAYSDYDIKQILGIASLANIAINNAMLFERSSTDMMTHLKMKYYFFNILGEKLELALSQNVPVAVIMFDIDHFKNFNDTYGHACGDYVLISVSKIIKSNVRQQDMASRYGGEEFTVMLPNTLREDAMAVAERIREVIEETDFVYEGQHMRVTISGGVSVYDKDLNPVQETKELVEQADKALYVSKNSGRNRITFADSEIIASAMTNCA
uniref:diguanylate cyclase n=1 Tax=uncultured Spirochaetaceae bacterium TaxID=201186 RepID=A0A650ENU9_9SPIO|nr:diguanylate cyclase [uncultured Spirochaetaceae bacterium]